MVIILSKLLPSQLFLRITNDELLGDGQLSNLFAATLQRGLITIRAGLYSNCVRFLPPLNVTDDEIDEAMAVLQSAVAAVLN